MRILWHRYKLCMVTFIISEDCRTGVSFDERMLSSFSVKIIVAILIFGSGRLGRRRTQHQGGRQKEGDGWGGAIEITSRISCPVPPPSTLILNQTWSIE